ncbi:hypothetical protein Tco_0758893, partial [Tanacetum coccineum]
MTQSQLKTYMMNYLKNQGTWKLSQLKNLSFEEVKKELTSLLKRFGEELQTKTPKRQKDDEDVEAKDDEPTKKSGKRRKQMARKGLHTSVDKDYSEIYENTYKPPIRSSARRKRECVAILGKMELMVVYINFGGYFEDDELEKIRNYKGGKPDENCYKMLKMMEKQAGIKEVGSPEKHKDWLVQEQTTLGKDFSNPDGEESHEDASATGAEPKQQQLMIPQTTAISNIKLPILKKEEYDIWAMEMEHYLEYIDNEVWKVIQNGNSKKRISTGVLSPVSAAEIQAVEKERKAKNILLMAIPKDHMRRFHGMDDAKEIWEAIRTRFGGNAKKMQKAVFKQQFKAFKISNSEGLEKGYDRF